MDHRIVELGSFDAVGLRTECPGGDISSIGPLWDRLFEGGGAQVQGSQGVVGVSWGDGADGFSYMAAHKVPAGRGELIAQQAGDGYSSLPVQGGRYVAVQWAGKPDDMKAAFPDIYTRLLPENGLTMTAGGVCLEDYPEDAHDPVTGTLKAELLVHVL